jgi:hypothetical protein
MPSEGDVKPYINGRKCGAILSPVRTAAALIGVLEVCYFYTRVVRVRNIAGRFVCGRCCQAEKRTTGRSLSGRAFGMLRYSMERRGVSTLEIPGRYIISG